MLLIYFQNNSFRLFYTSETIEANTLKINNIDFFIDSNSEENKGFTGFFDWLRLDSSTIIGIRIWFFDHQIYNQLLMKYSYVIPSYENKCMEIYFILNQKYASDISDDQDFTNNYVYRSQDNNYIITFETNLLEEAELDSLINICEILPLESFKPFV